MAFGAADTTNGIYVNTDGKWMIIKLATSFDKLPDYTEFNALFSEYKINSFHQTFTPYYSKNIPLVLNSSDTTVANAVPNYEVFSLPVNYTDDIPGLEHKTSAQIESYIYQSQRKSYRITPSGRKTYHTIKPKCVKYVGPATKDLSTSCTSMGAPYWLSTAAPEIGLPDERTVLHYGIQLAIRRVDGNVLNTGVQTMGGRMTTSINFSCRKVQ